MTVAVIHPCDVSENALVFERAADAESYCRARWGSAWPYIEEECPVIDPALAKQMIAEEVDSA